MTTEVENAQEIPSAAAEDKPDESVPAEKVPDPSEGWHHKFLVFSNCIFQNRNLRKN